MATELLDAPSEMVSEDSGRTKIADRHTETGSVSETTHADDATNDSASNVAGESQSDAGSISPAPNAEKPKAPLDSGPSDDKQELQPKIGETALHQDEIVLRMEEKVFRPIRNAMKRVVMQQHKKLTQMEQLAAGILEDKERGYGAVKRIVANNYDLIYLAKKKFGDQGRRVPIAGQPTYTEWLHKQLTITLPDGTEVRAISDRYVRKIMANQRAVFEQALETVEAEGTESFEKLELPASSSHNGANAKCGNGKVPHHNSVSNGLKAPGHPSQTESLPETSFAMLPAPLETLDRRPGSAAGSVQNRQSGKSRGKVANDGKSQSDSGEKDKCGAVERELSVYQTIEKTSRHSLLRRGNWIALFNVLDNFGRPGLAPLDAVLGDLTLDDFAECLKSLFEKIANEMHGEGVLRIRIERVRG